jgi:hypothetical protein
MSAILLQLKIIFAVAAGFFVLPPAAVFGGFTTAPAPSIKQWPSGTKGVGPYRPYVDEWKWQWLNAWYANTEDGVSGQQAWVWQTGVTAPYLVPYASTLPSWTPKWAVALAWSMWRNNANNLKRPLRNDTWAT